VQHDNGCVDGRLHIYAQTDHRTQVHSAQFSLVVTHPSTYRGRRSLSIALLGAYLIDERPGSSQVIFVIVSNLHP